MAYMQKSKHSHLHKLKFVIFLKDFFECDTTEIRVIEYQIRWGGPSFYKLSHHINKRLQQEKDKNKTKICSSPAP